MSNTIILLERVRQTCEPKSKNQVAIALGADQSAVRRMYRGKGYPNSMNCLEIAKILRMDLSAVLSYIAEDKAKSKSARDMVAKHLPRLLPTAGLTLALAVGYISNGYMDAQATDLNGISKVNPSIHYAKFCTTCLLLAQSQYEDVRRSEKLSSSLGPVDSDRT